MSLRAASAVEVRRRGEKDEDGPPEMPSVSQRPAQRPLPPPPAVTPPSAQAQVQRRKSAYQACSFDRKLALFSLFFHGTTQLVSLLAWHTLPISERVQRVGSVVYALGPWLLPTLVPVWYCRRRAWVMCIYRVGFFSFPLLRQPRGIQKVLGGAAQPGARGFMKDMLRLIWGGRLVAVIASAVMVPLSMLGLVPQLVLLLFSVAMVRSNPSLCSSALTIHPLTQQRMRGMHDLLHLASMLLPGGIGQAHSPLQQHSAALDCESFLSFLFALVGVVLPLALLVWTEPPASLRAWEERRYSSASAASGGTGSTTMSSGGASSTAGDADTSGGAAGSMGKPSGLWSRVHASFTRAALLLEAAMRELCGRSWMAPALPQHATARAAPGQGMRGQMGADLESRWSLAGWQRGMAWWLLISLIWGICRLYHSLQMAQ